MSHGARNDLKTIVQLAYHYALPNWPKKAIEHIFSPETELFLIIILRCKSKIPESP